MAMRQPSSRRVTATRGPDAPPAAAACAMPPKSRQRKMRKLRPKHRLRKTVSKRNLEKIAVQIRIEKSASHGLAAHGLDFFNHGFSRSGAPTRAVYGTAKIVDHNLSAAAGEFQGMGAANTATGTGYDGNAVVETNRHGQNSPKYLQVWRLCIIGLPARQGMT